MHRLTLLFTIAFSGICFHLTGQDKLINRKGEILEGKVLEIGLKNVKYKLHDTPESAVIVVPKRHLHRIDFEDGQSIRLYEKIRERMVRNIEVSNLGRNILTVTPFSVVDSKPGVGISYERTLGEKQVLGIVLPVSINFEENRYNRLAGRNSLNFYYFTPGLKIYPFGQSGRKLTYAVGPSLLAGYAKGTITEQFYEPETSRYATERVRKSVTQLGIIGNNYLSCQISPLFLCSVSGGLAALYMNKQKTTSTRPVYREVITVTGLINFNMSIRF